MTEPRPAVRASAAAAERPRPPRAVRGSRWAALGVLALAFVTGGPRASAGPWTQDLGKGYVKLDQGFFLADSYVDASGRVVRGAAFLAATTAVYGEVGLWRGLHVNAYLPYVVAQNTFADGGQFLNAGGGDLQLGVQWSPSVRLPVALAARVDVKVPLHDVGGIHGPLATQFPVFGDGQVDVTFWLSAGYALPREPLYALIEVGYRLRTEAYIGTGDERRFGDGIALNLQVGYTIAKRVLVAVNLGGVFPFRTDGVTKGYLGLGPSLYVPLWKGLAAEARFDPVVWARNSSRGYGFGLGLSYKR